MRLSEMIASILKENSPLKAKDICRLINEKYNTDCDTRTINHELYYGMKNIVSQNSDYRWKMGSQENKKKESIAKIEDTPLSKLCAYYLECIGKDMDTEISVYASNRYGFPDYGQLEELPTISEVSAEIYSKPNVENIINKVRRDKSKLVMQLGYPLRLRKVTGKSEFFVIEPLLLIPFDTESIISSGIPKLSDESPHLNSGAISKLSGLEKSELLNEIIQLNDELGINNNVDELPSLEELVMRLQNIRPEWSWNETIDPANINGVDMAQLNIDGIYNMAAVFFSERSKYTQGLEKELTDLRTIDSLSYEKSILGNWINKNISKVEVKNELLLQPIPLNDEQAEAVNKALYAPLTVVTGPPGTGKSQVVTSILINAIYKGQTVLFASKNHKAVDVVADRINGLTSRPVMLRLGSGELQAELAQYLSSLLSSKAGKEDYAQFEDAKNRYEEIINKIEENKKIADELIEVRNLVDDLEKSVEEDRSLFESDSFYKFTEWDEEKFNQTKLTINKYLDKVKKYNVDEQSTFIKLIWPILKDSRKKELVNSFEGVNSVAKLLNEKVLIKKNSEIDLLECKNFGDSLELRLVEAKKINNYLRALEKLKIHKSAEELAEDSMKQEEKLTENSLELWEAWSRLLPDKLTSSDRQLLSDYVAILTLIVNANANNYSIERRTFAKYYQLLPKVTKILSCWAVTSLSVRSKVPFEPAFFDLVVIDEASQCDIASAIPLLYRAKRAVIIGDSQQLTHITTITENQDLQLLDKYGLENKFLSWSYSGKSLFGLSQSVCSTDDIIVLRDHHRSHADIINYSNNVFYDGSLRVATKYEKLKKLDEGPAVRWINIKGEVKTPSSGGSVNEIEAREVVQELNRIMESNYVGTIGVVSPFRAQANKINELVQNNKSLSDRLITHDFLADTVHRFQGDERDVIIFSPVISNGTGRGSITFLNRTGNLFNVAITRARAALIIVGDKSFCSKCQIGYMEKFVEYSEKISQQESIDQTKLKENGDIYPAVPSGCVVSNWEKILYEALYVAGIRTQVQYPVGQYSLDLALFKGNRKLDIEVDGEKYHRNWDGELFRRDQIRNKRLIELGWDVKRFWVYQIRDDLKGCIEEIKDWIIKIDK